MEIFGYKISRKEEQTSSTIKSVVPPLEDGAIDTYKASGFYGTYLDIDGGAKNEIDLIKKYRDLSINSDVDRAIEDIVDVSIAHIEDEDPISIVLDKVNVSEKVKKAMYAEFDEIARIMHLRDRAHMLFRRWYIDGRIFFHKVIDTKKKEEGIKDIRYMDPRKVRKVRNIERIKDPKTGVELIGKIDEFFVFNEKGVNAQSSTSGSTQGVKMSSDSVTFVPSGLVDIDNNTVLSFLHPALRPANQLKLMENSLVIYRLSRAPERRIFYIDVGTLPKTKAEQYIKDIMNRYRNKLVYDQNSGEVRDDKRFMSMMEDYWLPRREGGKGTEIDTLPGGMNLGEIDDVRYFQRKLYESLKVPVSRLDAEGGGGMNFGKAAEISRDELKFVKFTQKLKNQFSQIFTDILHTQLLLKNIIDDDTWNKIRHQIRYKFAQDAYYEETKKQELLKMRAETLSLMAGFAEIYFPKSYVQREILQFSEDQIKEFEKEMLPATVVQDKNDQKEPEKK